MANAVAGTSKPGNRSSQIDENPYIGPNVDIIFLRGLASNDERESWSYRYREKFGYDVGGRWTYDILRQIAPTAWIMEFEYGDGYGVDHVFRRPGASVVATIQNHARSFVKKVLKAREHHTDRPIVMVAHSYGGLVLKQALLFANLEEESRKSILECTHGIIFIGTPHRGSDIGKIVASIISQAFPETNKTINDESVELLKIMEGFCNILGKIRIATFYEDKETKFPSEDKRLVVPPTATIIGARDESPTGIACQHHLLTSPNDIGDLRFLHLWRRIIEFTQGAAPGRSSQMEPNPLLRWYLPSPARNFFGRRNELSQIKNSLQSNGTPIPGKSLTIYGLRGMGKSELALQYIQGLEQPNVYSATLWIQCSDQNSLFDSLGLIYNELSFRCPYIEHEPRSLQNPSSEVTRMTFRAVIKGITKRLAVLSPRPWLVVLDDLQFHPEGIEEIAVPNGQTIITTTELRGFPPNSIELQGVDDAVAFDIITQPRYLGPASCPYSGYISQEDVQILNRKLGGNCFALNLLGASTSSTGILGSPGNIPRLQNPSNEPRFETGDFLAYAHSSEEATHILSVVNLAFGTLKSTNSESMTALKILGYLNPAGITNSLLESGITGSSNRTWMYLYDCDENEVRQINMNIANFQRNEQSIWDLLRFFGLVNDALDTETNQFRLRSHAIVNTWIQRNLDDIKATKCVLFVAEVLGQIPHYTWPGTWPQLYNGELASHLRCCYRHMGRLELFKIGPENLFVKYCFNVLSVPADLAAAFKIVQDYRRCLKISELALDVAQIYSGPVPPEFLHKLTRKLGIAYWKTGNLEKGLEISQKSVSLDRDGIGLGIEQWMLQRGFIQKHQMEYKYNKLNGDLEDEEDFSSDSEYEVPEDEILDILDILTRKVHIGKLIEIVSNPLNCNANDYDPDILFQLLRFDVELGTPGPESLEAELILKAFKSFIKNGIDLGWSDKYRNTILHIAAKGNHSLIVELLLRYGSRFDINATDFVGTTPLACAVAEGSRSSAELLIAAGAKLDFRASSTSPPMLFRALSTDIDLDFLRYLLEAGLKKTINEPHLHYGTILHHAAFTCPASVVKLLLEYEADENALDYMGLTPLGLAITLGYADGVIELLLPGTDQNILDYRGRYLGMLRCRGDDIKMIRKSHPPQDRERLYLGHSVLKRERARAEVLIYYWLRSQSYRPPGYTLEIPNQMHHILMHAGYDKFAVLVRGHEKALSVKKNGELHSDKCSGCGQEIRFDESAFICRRCCPNLFCESCRQNDAAVPVALRRHSCHPRYDVKLTESNCRPILNGKGFQFRRGATNGIFRVIEKKFKNLYPVKHKLWGMVESGRIDLVKNYVEKIPRSRRAMIDIDTKDFTGYTILHFAAEEEQDEIFTYLAAQGAELDASDIAGWSVAHAAATAARLTILKYMAVEGADLNVQDAYGRTPLHCAVLEGNFETTKLLLRLGVDQNIIDEDCRRACEIPSINSKMKQILRSFSNANSIPETLGLPQDPTSEARRSARVKKMDPDGYTISDSNVLAYSPEIEAIFNYWESYINYN